MISDAMLAELLPPVAVSKNNLGPTHIGFLLMKVQDLVTEKKLHACSEVTAYLYQELREAFPGVKNALRLIDISEWLKENQEKMNIPQLDCQ